MKILIDFFYCLLVKTKNGFYFLLVKKMSFFHEYHKVLQSSFWRSRIFGPASPFDKVLSCKIHGESWVPGLPWRGLHRIYQSWDILGLQVLTWVVGHSAPGSWSSHRSMKAPTARAEQVSGRSGSFKTTWFRLLDWLHDYTLQRSLKNHRFTSKKCDFFLIIPNFHHCSLKKNRPSPQPPAPHCVGSAASPRCSVRRSRPRTPCAGSGAPSPLLGWWPRRFFFGLSAVWKNFGKSSDVHIMRYFLWGTSMSNMFYDEICLWGKSISKLGISKYVQQYSQNPQPKK